ncbi:MAG: FkbM family methyltransferase, partial [Pseudomonadota bacterium]
MRRFVPLPQRVYRHLHFEGPISVPVGKLEGFNVVHHGYHVVNDLFWAGYGNGWEATSLRIWAMLAKQSTNIFDIGANTGVYSLAAMAINPKARIFAFEPIKRIADRLKNNVRLNNYNIEILEAAASDLAGESVIFEPIAEHAYSASLNPTMLDNSTKLRKSKITTIRADDFIASRRIERIELAKIDAEKHEPEVLAGFGAIIERDRPACLIEILDSSLGNKVARFFDRLDYLYFRIEEGRSIMPVEKLGAHGGN